MCGGFLDLCPKFLYDISGMIPNIPKEDFIGIHHISATAYFLRFDLKLSRVGGVFYHSRQLVPKIRYTNTKEVFTDVFGAADC